MLSDTLTTAFCPETFASVHPAPASSGDPEVRLGPLWQPSVSIQPFQSVPITIPLACLFSCFLVFFKSKKTDWRESFLIASVVWGMLATLITEFLSTLKLLEFWPLVTAWGLACATLVATLWAGWASGRREEDVHAEPFSRFEKLLLTYLFVVVMFTGVLAWISPPNTWDSMTYHMSRVAHWIKNGNVDFYSTAILRQLHSNPWAEYAILNFQILSDGDRFANFVQWFSMVGSVIGSSALAKELGANRRGQIFSSVVCATIPMGILQSTSTQTDYVVAFWLVCVVYFAIRFIGKNEFIHSMGLGASLGLALLTKGTAYIFAFPFVVWMIISLIKRSEGRAKWFVGVALLLALSVNILHYSRNYDLYGSPLGPGNEEGGFIYANQTIGPAVIASNLLRNAGLHGAIYAPVDKFVERMIYDLHADLKISINDPRTTWPGTEFHIQGASHNEDDAGNLVHFVLIVVLLAWHFSRRRRERMITIYVLSIVAASILFSAYLKWQPWHSRLHLPGFVLFSPFVGLMLSTMRRREISGALIVLLMLTSLPSFFLSTTKPVMTQVGVFASSRDEQYFIKRPTLKSPYYNALQVLAGMSCSDVGLIIGGDDWEYPVWVLLKEKMGDAARLEHVNVANVSKRKYQQGGGSGEFVPCAIFNLDPNPTPKIFVRGQSYFREWSDGPVNIYKRGQ